MNTSFVIDQAICLPAPDIEALIQGRIITAISRMFIDPGRQFALYPANDSTLLLPIERYYSTRFLPIAQNAFYKLTDDRVLIKAWAKCELCQVPDTNEWLDDISRLTIWTTDCLQEILTKRQNLFLVYLRVYNLPEPIEVSANINSYFMSLPYSVNITELSPILDDYTFFKRKQQLENRQPPLHPELEELQSLLLPIAKNNPATQQLENEIKVFLGWSNEATINTLDSDLAWIKNIAKVGNSSDGNEFEKLVRKSLIKLGFSCSNINPKANLDPDKLGGAGGVDFYCEYPYQVVGECKATKTEKIPSKTPGQLIQLGNNHLQEKYNNCLKLIVAAGELTKPAELTMLNNGIYMITPETLEKLVELQTKYKNSVNLIELKQCLQQGNYGLVDDKINEYIEKVEQEIKLRSHIIQVVKEMTQLNNQNNVTVIEIRTYYNAIYKSNLTNEIVQEILIELSSPLTGYLGRIKEDDWTKDRFYYLRDLAIN